MRHYRAEIPANTHLFFDFAPDPIEVMFTVSEREPMDHSHPGAKEEIDIYKVFWGEVDITGHPSIQEALHDITVDLIFHPGWWNQFQ